jgi:hypothetical protein
VGGELLEDQKFFFPRPVHGVVGSQDFGSKLGLGVGFLDLWMVFE